MRQSTDPALLRDFLGDDLFYDFCREFSGMSIYVPKYENVIRMDRNNHIKSLFYSGVPVCDIAKQYHLSERSIYKIIQLKK